MEQVLPKGWVETTVEDTTYILDNKRKPVSARERANRIGDIPYYGATGRAGWIDDFIFDEELVLLGEDGAPFFDKTKNVAYLIRGKSWVNNHAHVLKCKPNITTNGFLLNFLNYFNYRGFVGGTTRLKLNQGNLKKIPFPLPPLPEQQRLVAKLDSLFGHLEVLQARLAGIPALLKNFRQSVLTQAVTGKLTEEWRVVKLGTLGKWKGGGTPSKGNNKFWENGTVPWITAKDMKSIFLTDSRDKITKEAVGKSSAKFIKANSILIVTRSGILRRILPVGLNTIETTVNQDLKALELSDEYYPKFILFSLIGLEQNIRQTCMKSGTTVESVEFKDLKNYTIYIPKFEIQKQIVTDVEALFSKADRIAARYEALKEKIEQLPQAILAKAFRGELTEQLPTDGDARDLLKEIAALRAEMAQKGKKGRKKKKA